MNLTVQARALDRPVKSPARCGPDRYDRAGFLTAPHGDMTAPHLTSSDRRASRARTARVAVAAMLCGVLAVVGAPRGAGAQEDPVDDAAAARAALSAERDAAVADLASIEAELTATSQRL